MTFDIDTFKAQGLVGGGARPSLFAVQMNGLPVGTAAIMQQISFLCQSATLPASEVDPIEVPYVGRRIKVAGERVFRDWSVNIMNDEDFAIRDLMESWSNVINTMESNVTTDGNDLLSYKIDGVTVNQYSKGGPVITDPTSEQGIIRSYGFYGLWPSRIGDIRLDWSQGQAIETYDVTFSYDYWLPQKVGNSVATYSGIESGSIAP